MYRRHFKQVPFLIRSATMEWMARGFQTESARIEATHKFLFLRFKRFSIVEDKMNLTCLIRPFHISTPLSDIPTLTIYI